MKFNPEKCYVIHVTKKKIPFKLNYKLHNHTLQPVDNSKYLGVTISNDLDCGPHINNITSKTNKTLGFLCRNMKTCTCKLTYTSLVRPVVDYSSPVWNPSKKQQILQVEQIQRKAARYVFNAYLVRDSSAVRRLFVRLSGTMGRQSALHKENSGFATPTLGRHISMFRGYQILFSIQNPYINRFTNNFSIHS